LKCLVLLCTKIVCCLLLHRHTLFEHSRVYNQTPVFSIGCLLPHVGRTDVHWSHIRFNGCEPRVVGSSWWSFPVWWRLAIWFVSSRVLWSGTGSLGKSCQLAKQLRHSLRQKNIRRLQGCPSLVNHIGGFFFTSSTDQDLIMVTCCNLFLQSNVDLLILGRRHGYNIDANQEFLALGQLFRCNACMLLLLLLLLLLFHKASSIMLSFFQVRRHWLKRQ